MSPAAPPDALESGSGFPHNNGKQWYGMTSGLFNCYESAADVRSDWGHVALETKAELQKNPRMFFRFSVCGRIFWTTCEIRVQIPIKFGEVTNRHENCKNVLLFEKLWETRQHLCRKLLNCRGRRGAKECTIIFHLGSFLPKDACTIKDAYVLYSVPVYIFNTRLKYIILNFGSSLPKDACKSDGYRQEFSNEYLVFTIYLQASASIQPRTSPWKFAKI